MHPENVGEEGTTQSSTSSSTNLNGPLYDPLLSPAQIAKRVRTSLALRLECGELPEGKYLVKTRDDKIVIYVDAPDAIHREKNGRYERFTAETRTFLEMLEKEISQYCGVTDGRWNVRPRVEVIEGEVFKGGA